MCMYHCQTLTDWYTHWKFIRQLLKLMSCKQSTVHLYECGLIIIKYEVSLFRWNDKVFHNEV